MRGGWKDWPGSVGTQERLMLGRDEVGVRVTAELTVRRKEWAGGGRGTGGEFSELEACFQRAGFGSGN